MTTELDSLAQRCRDAEVAANPLWATVVGDHRFEAVLDSRPAEFTVRPGVVVAGYAAVNRSLQQPRRTPMRQRKRVCR